MHLPNVGNYLRRMGFPIIGGRTYLRQECAMLRKMLIGLATVAAIGIAAVPMDASARGGGGGGGGHGGGGGFHGGGASFRGGGAGFHGGLATGGRFSGGFGATRFAAVPRRTGFRGISGAGVPPPPA